MMMLCLGTVVYCLDADKKDVLVRINLIDSLPTSSLVSSHCNQDKLRGTTEYHSFNHFWAIII